jgi:hypothetical protein
MYGELSADLAVCCGDLKVVLGGYQLVEMVKLTVILA